MTNPSTVWTQLALPNPAAGSIPFVDSDNETIITDVANFSFDGTTKTLAVTNLVVTNPPTQQASGLAAVPYVAGGLISKQLVTAATIADLLETTLQTYSLPANVLSTNGKGVKIKAWGTFGATANGKTVRCYWGAANIAIDSGALTDNDVSWDLELTIFRTNVGAQKAIGFIRRGTAVANITSGQQVQGQDETAAIVINITGQNSVAAANDIVCKGMTVEFLV